MEKKRPILSISMLASDRMDTLPRCLESLTAIREAFPCELIIVDTSKNPKVHDIIIEYADKTATFEWCNDFSKARNVGLKMAEGEWFMFIDDDEWFAEPEELIEFFRSGEYKQYGHASHRIKNYHDPEFKTFSYGWVSRLIKLEKDTEFRSKVHEYLAPYVGECKKLYATSYHSGYIFKSQEEVKKHFDRNVTLLEKMEAEEPDNLRWKVQMMQEFRTLSDYENLATYGKKTLDYLWSKAQTLDLFHFTSIHIGYAIGLNQTGQYELVEELYQKAQKVVKDTVVSKAYMELCVAESYIQRKMYVETIKHMKLYFDLYEEYSKNFKKYEKESTGLILTDAFDPRYVSKAYTMLLHAQLCMQNHKALYEIFPLLDWQTEGIKVFFGVENEILATLIQLQDMVMMETVLQAALSSSNIRPVMMKAILDWKKRDKEQYRALLEVSKTLNIETWYKEYAALLTLSEDANKEEVLEIGKRFINLVPGIFGIPSEIADVLETYEIKAADLYLYVEFSKWQEALKERLETLQMEQVEELQKVLEDSALINDIRYYYFMMIFMEQKLLVAENDALTFDPMTDLLAAFSDYTCLCYEAMYGEQLQAVEVEQWPKKYQAAKWLQIYFAEVGENLTSAMGCLAKVIVIYPRLADAMKYYLERIQSEILNG